MDMNAAYIIECTLFFGTNYSLSTHSLHSFFSGSGSCIPHSQHLFVCTFCNVAFWFKEGFAAAEEAVRKMRRASFSFTCPTNIERCLCALLFYKTTSLEILK